MAPLRKSVERALKKFRQADARWWRTGEVMISLDEMLERKQPHLRAEDRHSHIDRLLEMAGAQKPRPGNRARAKNHLIF